VNDVKNRMVIAVARVLPSPLVRLAIRILKRQFVIGVVCIAFDENGRILVQRHTYDSPPWRLPGGLRERHESVFETVQREVWEESRCVVHPIALVTATEGTITFDIVVLADIVEVHPFQENAEVTERAFLHPTELPELSPVQTEFIEEAIRLRDQLSRDA
jgi:8-oxo-dGTP diphosphatase